MELSYKKATMPLFEKIKIPVPRMGYLFLGQFASKTPPPEKLQYM